MARALYRKYRSRSLGEVVGQEHITQTLSKALKSGRVRHAYLFSGPRGVGKTSVARILAHEVNQLPYSDDAIHLDIIEIDAASNRRIDEIRDLRDKVHITPTSAKFKVYIIDEVHMLTREAFNALLKTLEEPPEHCIFILATTEAHKLPETVISRTQHFTFKPIAPGQAAGHLGAIAKKEKIDISPEALELLAEYGQGSFRDSIGLLDQLSSVSGKITAESVRELVGLPPTASINKLIDSVESGDARLALAALDELHLHGASPAIVARLLAERLRNQVVEGRSSVRVIALLRQLLEVPGSPEPHRALEISILEAASRHETAAPTESVPEPPIEHTPATLEEDEPAPPPTQPKKQTKAQSPTGLQTSDWPHLLAAVKDKTPALYTALRLGIPAIDGDTLTLSFQFPLHQKKVNHAAQLEVIGQLIEEMTGAKMKISCIVDKSQSEPAPEVPTSDSQSRTDDSLETISNIFGTAEVLES